MGELTDKQKLFCKEYIIDLNATQAAIRAGYSVESARQEGCNLCTKVYIQKYISELIKPKTDKLDITMEYVLKGIKDIADDQIARHVDKLKAFELLGKYLKLFTEKVDINKDEPITTILRIIDKRNDKEL